MSVVTWVTPEWKKTNYGYKAVVGVSGDEKFTVEIRQDSGGFWYSSFGGANDASDQRVRSGPFVTLGRAKNVMTYRQEHRP